MNKVFIIGTLVIFICNYINASDGDCIINIQSLSINQPLFIKPGKNEFLFPNGNRKIILYPGEKIQLYCEKTFKADKRLQNVLLTCGQDSIDKYLECNERNIEMARNTNKKCQYFRKDAYIYEIGFEIFKNFIKLIEICYNRAEERSLYSKYELGPYSGEFQMNVPREFFKESDFHQNFNVSRLYSKYIQTKTFEKLLGIKSTNLYLNDNSIARGHLAAMADFIYAPHQLATFYYINVAPQWYTFNSFNWVVLEKDLRKFASKQQLNLDIYTGTYDTIELLSDFNTKVQLYLYPDERNNKNKIPIPKIFYKIIIDKKTNNGIVIIGINNPYVTEKDIEKDYKYCKEIKNKLRWFNLNLNQNFKYGYMYACTVEDFTKSVKHLQFIKVKGLLEA